MDNTRRKEKEGEAKKEVRIFTKAEVAKHDTVNDCWMIINGKVYDVTPFVDEHPGGDILMDVRYASSSIRLLTPNRTNCIILIYSRFNLNSNQFAGCG
jgi:hypothetical protein